MAKQSKAKTGAGRSTGEAEGQKDFFEKSYEDEVEERRKRPVECLGKTFENDDARRQYFLEKLAKKLKEPSFRKIEGFPIGKDEDILALSDPPYYTACPNPFLTDFVRHFGKPYDSAHEKYRREPFAADVSVARHDPYTLGHTYHTKVSPLAVVQYIEHFTEKGDVVLDCFAGSGMTGLAVAGAPARANADQVHRLKASAPRHAVLIDLCPAATHISNGNRSRFTPAAISMVRKKLREIADSFSGYRTSAGGDASRLKAWSTKVPKVTKGTHAELEYLVWSEVLACPNCGHDIEFGAAAFSQAKQEVADSFNCPKCRSELEKRQCRRVVESYYDPLLKRVQKRLRLVPLFAALSCEGKRFYRRAAPEDAPDVEVNAAKLPEPRPIMKGERFFKDALLDAYCITHIHQFFSARNLAALSAILAAADDLPYHAAALVRYLFTSIAIKASKLMNYNADGVGRVMKGTLYGSSLVQECNPFWLAEISLRDIERLSHACSHSTSDIVISTQAAEGALLHDNTIDYVWVDPPFGKNLMYAELNQLWEWWLRVLTAEQNEAVIDERRDKDLRSYTQNMLACFRAAHRVLKPGRWITVEFHNSSNAVWNAIQEALTEAGFVVADVRMLDKILMTYKQSQQGLVKVDLVISAYKPHKELEDQFALEAGTEAAVWRFIRSHVRQLPVFVAKDGQSEIIVERQNHMLYDRMVAFHVQRGITVPLSAAAFYEGLAQRFPERDGMYFLQDQVAEYDKKRSRVDKVIQFELFVVDEASAIQWLRRELLQKPQSLQDIHPYFMKQIGGWEKHEVVLELKKLLEQNFICYDGEGEVPSQIHTYLSTNYRELRKLGKDDPVLRAKAKSRWYVPDPRKTGDLEKLRERDLMREFWEYLPPGYKPAAGPANQADLPGLAVSAKMPKGARMKVIRMEAVRTGFKHCWQNRDYRTIVAVARRIPEDVLQEDAKLLMWYDQAVTRLGEE